MCSITHQIRQRQPSYSHHINARAHAPSLSAHIALFSSSSEWCRSSYPRTKQVGAFVALSARDVSRRLSVRVWAFLGRPGETGCGIRREARRGGRVILRDREERSRP